MATQALDLPLALEWSSSFTLNLKDMIETIDSARDKLIEDRNELEKEKTAWQILEPKLLASQVDDPIVLDVGGTKFACSIELLLKIPNTYLSMLVSGRWDLKTQKDGSIFIDRDPRIFSLVMTYLRKYGTDFNLSGWMKTLSEGDKMLFDDEAKFFLLQPSLDSLNSGILSKNCWNALANIIHVENRYLLFSSEADGNKMATIRAKVAGKKNTLVLALLSTGEIVGGYTTQQWPDEVTFQPDQDAFLLFKGVSRKLSVHKVVCPQYALYGHTTFGGNDLQFSPSGSGFLVQNETNSYEGLPQNCNGKFVTNLQIWHLPQDN